MAQITISRSEYAKLRRKADAYERLASRIFDVVVKDPIQEVIEDFHITGLYTQAFLEDLESGLRKSSYGKL